MFDKIGCKGTKNFVKLCFPPLNNVNSPKIVLDENISAVVLGLYSSPLATSSMWTTWYVTSAMLLTMSSAAQAYCEILKLFFGGKA